MKVLVTGATGFLGLSVVKKLVGRGDHVRALCRRPSDQLDCLGVEQVRADLRDRWRTVEACRDMDGVLHVAGVAGIWGPWRHFYENNVLATEHVLAGCVRHGVPRLVFTSSPSVVFDGRPQKGVDESAPYARRWLCHYPHSKAQAERLVLAASGAGKLTSCALRPHLIWGPGDRQLVPRLLDRARRGRLRRVGTGDNRIDMLYVDNAADAHLGALDALGRRSAVAGRVYFVSQGAPVGCWQWIDQLLALAGLPPVRRAISLSAAWGIGCAMEGLYAALGVRSEPPMTRFLALQLGVSHYFDIRRAREDFGYNPQISSAEGMRRLGEALRRQAVAEAAPGGSPLARGRLSKRT